MFDSNFIALMHEILFAKHEVTALPQLESLLSKIEHSKDIIRLCREVLNIIRKSDQSMPDIQQRSAKDLEKILLLLKQFLIDDNTYATRLVEGLIHIKPLFNLENTNITSSLLEEYFQLLLYSLTLPSKKVANTTVSLRSRVAEMIYMHLTQQNQNGSMIGLFFYTKKDIRNKRVYIKLLDILMEQGITVDAVLDHLMQFNNGGWTIGHSITLYQDDDTAQAYLEFLDQLLERVTKAEAIFALLILQAEKSVKLGRIIAEYQDSTTFQAYLNLLDCLLDKGVNAGEIFAHLQQLDEKDWSIGHTIVRYQDTEATQAYFRFIEKLLEKGIKAEAVYKYFTKPGFRNWTFYEILFRYQDATIIKYYLSLLNLLMVRGVNAQGISWCIFSDFYGHFTSNIYFRSNDKISASEKDEIRKHSNKLLHNVVIHDPMCFNSVRKELALNEMGVNLVYLIITDREKYKYIDIKLFVSRQEEILQYIQVSHPNVIIHCLDEAHPLGRFFCLTSFSLKGFFSKKSAPMHDRIAQILNAQQVQNIEDKNVTTGIDMEKQSPVFEPQLPSAPLSTTPSAPAVEGQPFVEQHKPEGIVCRGSSRHVLNALIDSVPPVLAIAQEDDVEPGAQPASQGQERLSLPDPTNFRPAVAPYPPQYAACQSQINTVLDDYRPRCNM